MKKQLLLIILALFPILVNAEAVEIDGIYYNLITKGKVATVTSNPNKYSGNIIIPETVVYDNVEHDVIGIGGDAFYNCSELTSVTIGNNVTSIGNQAFWNCVNMISVTIGNKVTEIGQSSFRNCSSLLSVNIPNSVLIIDDYAFSYCSGLTSIDIPNSVTSIGYFAFNYCTGLESVNIGISANFKGAPFANCSNLFTVTINSNYITSYDGRDYYSYMSDCFGKQVRSYIFGEGIENIGNNACYGCYELANVSFPSTLKSIGYNAFKGTLWDDSLPEGLTYAGHVAYKYKGEMPMGTTIELIDGTNGIAGNAFYNCSGLTSIILPNSLTNIGDDAFYGCSGLSSIKIPNNVTNIGAYAFRNCSRLSTISLGISVNDIKNCAFANCRELSDVYCFAAEVPRASGLALYDSFEGSDIKYATLHVPSALIETYQVTSPWNQFGMFVPLTDEEMSEIQKCCTPTISYFNGILEFHSETEDVEFNYEITDSDIKKGKGSELNLTATYQISVYAMKAGYANSNIATATLCWIDKEPKSEGVTNEVHQIAAHAVMVQSNDGVLSVQGADEGEIISVYNLSGQKVGSAKAGAGITNIITSLHDEVAVIKIGKISLKVLVK